MYFCPLCTFQFSSVGDVLSNLRLVHSSDPHFVVTCGLDGCAKSATSFSALYSHLYRNHPNVIQKRSEAVRPNNEDDAIFHEGNSESSS